MISVERVSRAAREDDEGSGEVVIDWDESGDERGWMGERLLSM